MKLTKVPGLNIRFDDTCKSDLAEAQLLEIVSALQANAKNFKLSILEIEERREYYFISKESNDFLEVLKTFLNKFDFISVLDAIAYTGECAKILNSIDELLFASGITDISAYYDNTNNVICINDVENEDEYIKVYNSLGY